MLVCFWIVILCTLCFVLINIYKMYFGTTYKVFFDKKCSKFDYEDCLANIIKRKLDHLPKVDFLVDKDVFLSLNLERCPVYIVDKNKIGNTHLKLYKTVLEKLNTPINFVVLGGNFEIDNHKINVVNVDKSSLSVQQFSTLNILNVNKKEKKQIKSVNNFGNLTFDSKNSKTKYFDNEHNQLLCSSYDNVNFYSKVDKGKLYQFDLPQPFYNYIIKGKKNKIEVYDIFGQKVIAIVGSFVANMQDSSLKIRATKDNTLELTPYYSSIGKNNLKLLGFNLTTQKFQKEMQNLYIKAKEHLLVQPFVCEEKTEGVNVTDLKTYFRVAVLRKNYFDAYMFLLKKIFGIKIVDDVLIVNPTSLIDFDFDIGYTLDGLDYLVKYSHISGEKVRLNYVGHKIGHQDDYVFGF